MNNLTTMMIDLLLKRLLEERYSEFYTESLSESKQYSPNTLLADKYLRFKSVIHQISFLLIFLDISLGVAAFCLDISSSLVSFALIVDLLYCCISLLFHQLIITKSITKSIHLSFQRTLTVRLL